MWHQLWRIYDGSSNLIHLISAVNFPPDPHRYPNQQGWYGDARYEEVIDEIENSRLSTIMKTESTQLFANNKQLIEN